MRRAIRKLLARYDRGLTVCPEPLAMARERVIRPTLRMLVADLLDPKELRFLIVGAFDGLTNDELYPLVKQYHFRGAALEPQPAAFSRLLEAYRDEPQVTLVNAALDWREGKREMFAVKAEFHSDQFRPQLASFNRDVVLRYPGVGENEMESFPVDCVTLKGCLARGGLDAVDVLQIDTEGFDFEVIKMLDAAGLVPKIIKYEHHHLSRQDNHDCLRLLMGKGYDIAYGDNDAIAALMR
jgi:FkbM family methyltransferase